MGKAWQRPRCRTPTAQHLAIWPIRAMAHAPGKSDAFTMWLGKTGQTHFKHPAVPTPPPNGLRLWWRLLNLIPLNCSLA
eukprot:10379183-Alexandrium_andersonii.AAC.1